MRTRPVVGSVMTSQRNGLEHTTARKTFYYSVLNTKKQDNKVITAVLRQIRFDGEAK